MMFRHGRLRQVSALLTLSGASSDISDIPAWANKVTLIVSGMSGNGTSNHVFRLGSGGAFDATGYSNTVVALSNGAAVATGSNTSGMVFGGSTVAINARSGVIELFRADGNRWMMIWNGFDAATTSAQQTVSEKTLSGPLDAVRFTSLGGVDTFDGGSVFAVFEE